MSRSRSSRWSGSSAKKLRRRPTRSPSPPKRYATLTLLFQNFDRFSFSTDLDISLDFVWFVFIVIIRHLFCGNLWRFWCLILWFFWSGIQHWEIAVSWGGEEEDQTRVWAEGEASWGSEEDVRITTTIFPFLFEIWAWNGSELNSKKQVSDLIGL